MTTNYYNTLILIADDSPTTRAVVPNLDKESVATQQFTMVSNAPYTHTSDDVIFARVAEKEAIPAHDVPEAREAFFSKGRACLRTSPLAKTHGWGIHADADGKIALVAAESEAYQRLLADESVTKLKAMRRSKG